MCNSSLHYPPPGEFVAQFKFTVLLMANGPLRITNSLFDPELCKSEHEVEDAELKVRGCRGRAPTGAAGTRHTSSTVMTY